MSDAMVLATQQWLNKTYKNVPGYNKAPENGQTGWPTIYSLREGLQHELGLTAVSSGFGDATKSALASIISYIKLGYSGNIVKLIKGAFWCKGINPNSFNEKYDSDLDNAVKKLQSNAGLAANGTLTVNLMAALFDMSAFILLSYGDNRIREMQQALNSLYSNELGVLPCDGIYQRDTNTALIYYLQRVEGMDSNTANGNYGPGTINRTPTVNPGAQGPIVKIIQYGLYVNGFYTGAFDGNFGSNVSSAIINFRKFMNLPPFTSTADLTVIKGLLTSNGNTSRDSNTFDTATQLTAAQAQMIKSYGFNIVGRYLTGSVGTGANRRNKNLTVDEIKNITGAGLSIFPIYEDGGYEEKYFSYSQGYQDAVQAVNASRKLGFSTNTTIYFAVDVDIQDGDIDGLIVPYFKGIHKYLSNTEYKTGVYGTRNVCLHVADLVSNCFVADMSYGWSGNLGFRMPQKWSFDQFVEYGIGGVDIDQVASSGRDAGTSSFVSSNKFVSSKEALKKLFGSFNLSLNSKINIVNWEWFKLVASVSSGTHINGGTGAIEIGKDGVSSIDVGKWLGNSIPKGVVDISIEQLNKLSFVHEIKDGAISIDSTIKSDGTYSVSVSVDIIEISEGILDTSISLKLEAIINLKNIPGYKELNSLSTRDWVEIAAIVTLVVIASIFAGPIIAGTESVATIGAATLSIAGSILTDIFVQYGF